jgi:hypothetical protein
MNFLSSPTASIFVVALLGAGPGLYVDFVRLSFPVPTSLLWPIEAIGDVLYLNVTIVGCHRQSCRRTIITNAYGVQRPSSQPRKRR